MILYINSCIREGSRTDRIARALLEKLVQKEQDTVTELVLTKEELSPLNEERLNYRTALIEKGDYEDRIFDYAKQFAAADVIVISAPYWDSGFPAYLKIYLENIYVTGIVSHYGNDGRPVGLCRGKKLYFVTTSGGPYMPSFSYDYIKSIAQMYFGIPDAELIMAEMLDVDGFDAEKIVEETILSLR